MKLQVLISTMHRTDTSFSGAMNLPSDALIINQVDKPLDEITDTQNGKQVKMLSFCERGLSKSRNRALENADGDICVIADEDILFEDGCKEKILEAHQKYPGYDIIAFIAKRNAPGRQKRYYDKPTKMGYIRSMKILSCEISVKRKAIVENGIRFNESFGTGSGKYLMGEENIFLYSCLKKGLKILFLPITFCSVSEAQSSWFFGWNEKLFYDKGAISYEMSPLFSIPLILQFAVRKYPTYKNKMSFFAAVKAMMHGRRQHKNSLK